MPDYLNKNLIDKYNLLKKSKRPVDSALPFTAPTYGAQQQLESLPDDSPPLSEEQASTIRAQIGICLYYARCIDNTLLCPLNKLSKLQSQPTQKLQQMMDHFLQYILWHPSTNIVFHPSDMQLCIHSGAFAL